MLVNFYALPVAGGQGALARRPSWRWSRLALLFTLFSVLSVGLLPVTAVGKAGHVPGKPGGGNTCLRTGFGASGTTSGKDTSAIAGEEVSFPVTFGRTNGRGFLIRSAKKSNRYLIVVHEWWGLNKHVKQEAARLARALPGVNVLAVDLYDRQTTTNPDMAGQLQQQVKPRRAAAIVLGAAAYAGPNARIATLGWGFGAGWAMQGAIQLGKQAVGSVIYYGHADPEPDNLKPLQAEVLGIFAARDQAITPAVVQALQEAMTKAGKKLTVKTYAAGHAFADPGHPQYVKLLADEANAAAVAFLRRTLKVRSR